MEDRSEWKIRIVVLDRGFVKVCYMPNPDGHVFWIPYANARTIRVWGTIEGLAQLVTGPTAQTKLDAIVPEGRMPVRAIIDVLEVEQSKWVKHLT